ncbi:MULTISPECIES: LysR family transcriptional regulator [Rhizobium]|uniref:LysR family transcriptional regulator n=1 Tax=Rhizobium TaxID=379 RepID=UPI001C82E677|nr:MULTISPECIES: LysR family transcriptional regulator [Rhizobium]MBX4925705.1 LysR family transcriptional regulator [Rhizobium binae]MBX5177416.1 LysR family transcriptional regulator [Rhizobium lentis]
MMKIDLKDIGRLDFNLGVTFLAVWRERSVSKAAQQLSLSQSAVSSALTRLRDMTGDPLFVRAEGMMLPTPRAERMASDIEGGLLLLKNSFLARPEFDPNSSERHFSLGMSDDFQLAVGPEIARRGGEAAPGITISFRQTNRQTAGTMLQSGEIDLAIVASWPKRSVAAFEEVAIGHYACLFDPRTAVPSRSLDLASFLELPHVLVSYSGRAGIVDEALKKAGLTRRVQTALTHFSALPAFLVGRKAVATLPSHAAIQLACHTPLLTAPVPIDLGSYGISIVWRRDQQNDSAHDWIRSVVRTAMLCELDSIPQRPD